MSRRSLVCLTLIAILVLPLSANAQGAPQEEPSVSERIGMTVPAMRHARSFVADGVRALVSLLNDGKIEELAAYWHVDTTDANYQRLLTSLTDAGDEQRPIMVQGMHTVLLQEDETSDRELMISLARISTAVGVGWLRVDLLAETDGFAVVRFEFAPTRDRLGF